MKRAIALGTIMALTVIPMEPDTLKDKIDAISKREMQSVIEFLSHDHLEGRAPGARGGKLAEAYVKSIFKLLDLKPAIKGRYEQPFLMKGYQTDDLKLEANQLIFLTNNHVIGNFTEDNPQFNLEGDALFVGFGIISETWGWNDYKKIDVKNKFLIIRVNDPGMFNQNIFEGKTLTYFGRWIYKLEEAARQGAAGVLLIHTDESAGYGWQVVKNSWSGEELYLPSTLENNLKFRGWIKESTLKEILATKKINLNRLYLKSLKKDFTPVKLGFKIRVSGKIRFREVVASNIVAEIPGKTDRRIVVSAHIDHLGVLQELEGDKIFNGAIDNGSAVAAMIITAKILKQLYNSPHFTTTFLACQAEEAGLLGSRYYVENCDRSSIIANINFESTPVWEKSRSILAVGARFSTLEDMLKKILEKEKINYTYFSMANQGFFYRSDQFSFARYNIPSIWISAGEEFESGINWLHQFFVGGNYHTVRDQYNPEWPLESLKQTITYTLLLIDHLHKTKAHPKWKIPLTFPLENPGKQSLKN